MSGASNKKTKLRESAPRTHQQEASRRKVLVWLSLGSGGLAAAAAGYPVARAVLDPAFQDNTAKGGWQMIGKQTDFALDKTVLVTFIRPNAAGYSGAVKHDTAYVTRRAGDWLALHNVCMHLGCPVRHEDGSGFYFCPCHGGVYNAEGVNVAGPPKLPLQRLSIRLSGEDVQLQSTGMPLPTLLWPGRKS